MNVIPLLVLCSLLLAATAVAMFARSIRRGDADHTDHLALLPLEDDEPSTAAATHPASR